MKKIVCLITSLIILFGMASAAVSTRALSSGGFTYTVSGTNAVITGYTGSATNLVIPSKIGSYTVNNIGAYAFAYQTKLTRVTLPSTVTALSNCAFAYCSNVTEFILPSGLKTISTGAFAGCSKVESFTIPSTVTKINANAFEQCTSLKTFTFPSKLKAVTPRLFDGCTSLTKITLGASVSSIDAAAFENCPALKTFAASSYNTSYTAVSGVLYSKDKKVLVAYPPAATATSYTVASGATEIKARAFYHAKNLSSVSIPSTVTAIGSDAFYASKLYQTSSKWTSDVLYISRCLIESRSAAASYTVASGTRVIADGAFKNCNNLKKITLATATASVGNAAFSGCKSLSEIAVGSANGYLTSVSGVLLDKAKTRLIAYPIGKTSPSYTLPSSVRQIQEYAFMGAANLKTLTVPQTVTSIGDYAFFNSGISSVYVKSAVIGNYAFAYCKQLASVHLSDTVQYVGAKAFYNCNNLKLVHIDGNTLKSLGAYCLGYYSTESNTNGKIDRFAFFAPQSAVADKYAVNNGFLLKTIGTPKIAAPTYGTAGISLSWGRASEATGYRVYRRTAASSWERVCNATVALSYTDKTAQKGVTYFYTVRAYKRVDDVTHWGLYDHTGKAACLLAAPKLAAPTYGTAGISLRWSRASGATGYRVYRRTAASSWERVCNATTALSYTDKTARKGVTYFYTIRAYKKLDGANHWGLYDKIGKAACLLAAPKLAAPTYGTAGISLRWSRVSGATGYRVYRRTTASSWERVCNATTALSYTDKTARKGVTYFYTVRAYKKLDGANHWGLYDKIGKAV